MNVKNKTPTVINASSMIAPSIKKERAKIMMSVKKDKIANNSECIIKEFIIFEGGNRSCVIPMVWTNSPQTEATSNPAINVNDKFGKRTANISDKVAGIPKR